MRVPIQQWANENKPDDDLLYKGGYWDQIMFVRDHLKMMVSVGLTYEETKDNVVFVVSTHTSKSVKLPVYSLEPPGKGIRFILRDNFYNWKASVVSDKPIDIDPSLTFQADPPFDPSWSGDHLAPCYFEGFPNDLIFGYYSKSDKKKFSVELGGEFSTFAFIKDCMRSYERDLWLRVEKEQEEDSIKRRDEYRKRNDHDTRKVH